MHWLVSPFGYKGRILFRYQMLVGVCLSRSRDVDRLATDAEYLLLCDNGRNILLLFLVYPRTLRTEKTRRAWVVSQEPQAKISVNFEDTDLATLAHLEITVAKCSTYSSSLAIFTRKTVYTFCIQYPTPHIQASLNEVLNIVCR